ncbi:unnamed protein product (macronuclear) [Paramecium tetraurelia]|uniref:Chromosome undetermined scaffold_1, whole genome shotgun sequence n=1 Tax=Paramecium tetraurelia TaxID=5888 RepID=Q6BGA1_PARTE|nr:hypothetical protein [Paramecium tetraurelia strain d4-2]XP_001423381.1 uncharacterized protein GSPATT00000418001 [Paramecium tetraurelia]CAH03319.1 hypothetical protein PTMB.121 [Paramecium tetraurelia]CAK55983.1 unnamed protein product [Paramecium tetraurelia]|eukprot:XP_001423381.1 hypothetical protein (macronuclear) [Paramecium tetraurelia strain d4-2]
MNYQQQNYIPNKVPQDKRQQIIELQQLFPVVSLHDKVNQDYQEQYLITILPDIQIKLVINKDYPLSQAKYFVISNLQHESINETNWQIKVQNKETFKLTALTIKELFLVSKPQQDPYIEELANLKNKIKEEQIIQRIQQVDLKTLFQNVPVTEYKKIIESGKLLEYIEKLPDYKLLTQYIIELGKTNENFADHLIEQDKKIRNQKAELISLAAYFDRLKTDVISKDRECKEVQNRLDPYHIVRQLDEQINQLDEISNEKIEDLNGSTIILNKQFDEDLQQYLNLRKQQHKLQIKKDKLEQTLLQRKMEQMKQQQ